MQSAIILSISVLTKNHKRGKPPPPYIIGLLVRYFEVPASAASPSRKQ